MEASSKPTDESLHLYDTLPYNQDFDLLISDAKLTADNRTDFYDRSLTSRKYALIGVACSSIFGCSCIIASIAILVVHGVSGVTTTNTTLVDYTEIVTMSLALVVTLSAEAIGFVHGISLRSALASESRLRFNTNLRLLTAARGWYNPNGALLNGISALLLIISYNSATLVVCFDFSPESTHSDPQVAIAGIPLLILGVALLLQVMIALSAMRAVNILTWSSSPFHLTAALVHHAQLTPATFRCMRCVSDLDTYGGPAKPREIQPSAWQAHPSIRKVIISLWVIVAVCAGWAAIIMYIWDKWPISHPMTSNALTSQTWSFSPTPQSNFIVYDAPGVNLGTWIILFVIMAVFQGPLTLGLHCSELIANVIRDERQWRYATGRKGLITAINPVEAIFTHPVCIVLFVAKPFLHWMFGQSFVISNPTSNGQVLVAGIFMFTAQIWNLCFALLIFACFFTFVALRRPRGPQPAAYGHIQTLANLVDEWSPVMWWGHKKDGIPYCHAGTCDHPLPDVKMDCIYAGSSAESLVPLS